MAFGGGLAMLTALGFVVLGPRRTQDLLRQVAHWKSELAKFARDLESEAHSTDHTSHEG